MRLSAAAENLRQTQQQSQPAVGGLGDQDIFGDSLGKNSKENFRIGLLNIGGIGLYSEHWKTKELRKFIVEKQLDVIGIKETNVHWKSVAVTD